MKNSIFFIFLVSTLALSSCTTESTPISKHYTTYTTQSGNISIKDSLLATVEWDKSSDLAFRSAGVIAQISVQPGDTIKKWQVLAVLGNRESSIQLWSLQTIENELKNLSATTTDIKWGTQEIATATAKLYDERVNSLDTQIRSLQNTLKQAKQNLGNQTQSIESVLKNYITDLDRISTSMLFEWDRILGITTNFEYANDGWESYLGTRIGNAKSEAENKWNELYSKRWKIRTYIQSWVTISDIDLALTEATDMYIATRALVTSMNTMLQNSVVWGGLAQEKLDGWLNLWSTLAADNQRSEWAFTAWKNGIADIIDIGSDTTTVAQKDVTAIEFELEWLENTKNTLLAEKETKLKEIQTNVYTIDSKKWEVALQIAQTQMSAALAGESGEYNIIRAPYDGIILNKYSEIGMVAGAGVPIIRVTSNKSKLAKIYINNGLYGYKLGSTLSLTSESWRDTTFTGTITLVQKEKDTLYNKNYIELKIEGDTLIGSKLNILLERRKWVEENGILIPVESIISRYGPPWVYILDNGAARFQLIEILAADMSYAEVSGIFEDTVVIVEWKENIYDGEILLTKISE